MQQALNENQRRAYLHALGIPVWVRRKPKQATASHPVSAHEILEETLTDLLTEQPATDTEAPSPAPSIVEPATVQAPVDCSKMDWQALHTSVQSCQQCSLHAHRNQAVFGSGSVSADYLIIGDAPSSEDDRKGNPFTGNSGQLLVNMLNAISQNKQSVYLTNMVKCRPPTERSPNAQEILQCMSFLHRQIELLQPRAILVLGRVSAQSLLNIQAPLSQLRGKIHQMSKHNIPVVVSYHPKNLLIQGNDKRKAWEDLKLFRTLLDESKQ